MDTHKSSHQKLRTSHRALERSCSVQPDVSFHTTSFYSTKRNSKCPGRSLTEIFTDKPRSRASSSDPSVTLRRRTLTTGAPLFLSSSATKESREKAPLNRSFSELTWSALHFNERSDSSDVDGSCYSTLDHEGIDSGEEDTARYPLLASISSSAGSQKQQSNLVSPSERNEKGSSQVKSRKAEHSFIWRLMKCIFKILFWCITVAFIITLVMLLLSTYLTYERTQCDIKRKAPLPLGELEERLSVSVIGQEVAVDVILNSLKAFEADKANPLLILWMVGWSGTGKTHAINVLKNVFSSVASVFTVIPSFYPQHNYLLLKQKVSKLYYNLDVCSPNVIIIDGWDEDNQPWQILEELVVNHIHGITQGNAKGKSIVVLSGMQGSKYVNRKYLQLNQEGRDRESLTINDFDSIADKVSQVKAVNDSISAFVFVPFLPMEAKQVQLCIAEELSKLIKTNLLTKDYDYEQVSEQVIRQMDFIPASHPLLALTGCKRVQPLVHMALSRDLEN